jgi:hypothetical protein
MVFVGIALLAYGLRAWAGSSYYRHMMKDACDQASPEACKNGCVCPSGVWYSSQATKYKAVALALLLLGGAIVSASYGP